MAVTFTQVPVKLRIDKASLASVIDVLDLINTDNPNKIYTVDTSFHVGSIEQAETTLVSIDRLFTLGAIDQAQCKQLTNQINGFEKLYLQ